MIIVGNFTKRMFVKSVSQLLLEDRKEFGPIWGAVLFRKPQLIVADPELLKLVLAKDAHLFLDRETFLPTDDFERYSLFFQKGEHWKSSRAILTPTFTSGKMKKMYHLMNECADDLLEIMAEKSAANEQIDLKPFFGNYTLDVIATCCFATKTNANRDSTNDFVKHVNSIFKIPAFNIVCILALPTKVATWLGISFFPKKPIAFFSALITHLIRERKETNVKRSDFLQLVIDAGKDSPLAGDLVHQSPDHDGDDHGDGHVFKTDELHKKKSLEDKEIIFQSILFFIAGQETTASLLTFTFYSLALNPHIQTKLYNEIKTATDESPLTYELIAKLTYLDAVISESLRKYPPLTEVNRVASEDYVLGNTGITVEKGVPISIPIYAIHHDAQLFENPDLYDPDRFMPENRDNIKPYSYLPFGTGPRSCVGMRFALLEAKLIICKALLSFEFVQTKDTPLDIDYIPMLGLLTSIDPIRLKLQARK